MQTPRLSTPLFHGTSSAFLDSILELGLGGYDPVAAMHGVRCLQALFEVAQRALSDDERWLIDADVTRRMCEQSRSSAGFNFRHGGAYLSASRLSAVRYALDACVGSELLSQCVKLHRWLRSCGDPSLISIEQSFPTIFALAENTPKPILIELHGVPTECLATERGEPIAQGLASLESSLALGFTGKDAEAVLQCHDFVLREPVTVAGDQVFVINVLEPDPSFPLYSLSAFESGVA